MQSPLEGSKEPQSILWRTMYFQTMSKQGTETFVADLYTIFLQTLSDNHTDTQDFWFWPVLKGR